MTLPLGVSTKKSFAENVFLLALSQNTYTPQVKLFVHLYHLRMFFYSESRFFCQSVQFPGEHPQGMGVGWNMFAFAYLDIFRVKQINHCISSNGLFSERSIFPVHIQQNLVKYISFSWNNYQNITSFAFKYCDVRTNGKVGHTQVC